MPSSSLPGMGREVGIETAESCSEELDRIVEVLLEGADPVEFC